MGKPNPSYQKRLRERKKQERRAEKAKRRAQRRAEKKDTQDETQHVIDPNDAPEITGAELDESPAEEDTEPTS